VNGKSVTKDTKLAFKLGTNVDDDVVQGLTLISLCPVAV
jgi:hypothetical protein